MINLLFSYLFLCSPIYIYSQEASISGKVIIADVSESIDLNSISVFDVTTQTKSKVNSLGIFTIKVNLNDELVFTSDFTEKRVIKMTESIIKKGFITVHLDLKVIQLAEANINTLKKDLKDNISKEDSDKTKLYKSLGLNPDLQYIEVNPNMTSSLNSSGVAYLIAKVSGRYEKDKKINEFFKKENKLEDLKDYFTENSFEQKLKIPKHKISEFLRYCYNKEELNLKVLIDGNRYEEIEVILEKEAPTYLNLLNGNS